VRIAWHVKRPTSNRVKRSEFRMCLGTGRAVARAGNEQVGMRAPGSEQGRRGASMATPANRVHAATVLGERSSKYGVVVVPTPADPMRFLKSTRDVKARSAAKEHTNAVGVFPTFSIFVFLSFVCVCVSSYVWACVFCNSMCVGQ